MISRSALIGHLAGELWVMEPNRLDAFFASLLTDQRAQAVTKFSIRPGNGDVKLYRLESDGSAHIPIAGVILKSVPEWMSFLGIEATSTLKTQEAIQAALNDSSVSRVVLDIESPGGTVSGVQELAQTVFDARQAKPVRAEVSDMMASAAYWVGSQADEINANRSAMIGSIGVYAVLIDFSKGASEFGAKVHVVRSGPAKGIGVDGAPITSKELEYEQRLIDSMADLFVAEVARGRGMTTKAVEKLATGEVWLAEEATDKGLIDSVRASVAPTEDEDPEEGSQNTSDATDDPTAPVGATDQEKEKMTEQEKTEIEARFAAMSEEIAAVRAEAAALNSKAEELEALNLDLRKAQCSAVIDAGIAEGRLTPELIEHAEKAAGHGFDIDAVRAFVAAHEPAVRPDAESDTPKEPSDDAPRVDKGVADAMRFLGNSEDDIAEWGNAHESMGEVSK